MTRPKLRPEDEPGRWLREKADPPPDPLMDAVEAYKARFNDSPWLVHIPLDRMPAWLDAIRKATRTGRPLTEADLVRVVGHGYPPPGAMS